MLLLIVKIFLNGSGHHAEKVFGEENGVCTQSGKKTCWKFRTCRPPLIWTPAQIAKASSIVIMAGILTFKDYYHPSRFWHWIIVDKNLCYLVLRDSSWSTHDSLIIYSWVLPILCWINKNLNLFTISVIWLWRYKWRFYTCTELHFWDKKTVLRPK